MRTLVVALVVALAFVSGCGSYVQSVSRSATAGAVDGLTSPDATWKLDGAAAEASAAGVAGARDEALGPATTAEVQALVASLGASLREQLLLTRDEMLGKALQREIATLRTELLGPATRALVRAMVDEALGGATTQEIAALREELVGAPFRADLDALRPNLAALVQAALAPVKADADAEAAKYKTVAIGLGAGAAALLLALGVAIHELRAHRKALAAFLERGLRA